MTLTYHTNNLVISIQWYAGLLVSVKGGLLLDKLGGGIICSECVGTVYFWRWGIDILLHSHCLTYIILVIYIHLVQIYWWLWRGIIDIKEIQDGGVR